jgi:DNA-binding transcriptional regulator YdaS (Cro superfamily)
MTLTEFFSTKPRGSKLEMATALGISKTWLSLIITNRQAPSPQLCNAIEQLTKGQVTRETLRPDVFGGLK